MFVAVDGFRVVSEVVGDRAIRNVAGRLAASSRPGEWLVRLSGDEFAVLMTGLQPGGADLRAQELLAVLDHPMLIDGRFLAVSAAAGVVVNDGTSDLQELLRRADIATLSAKQQHAGVVVFGPDLAENPPGKPPGVELVPKFQPIVDLRDGTVVGMESFTRWREPPAAGTVAATVLTEALRFAAQCARAGFELKVHVDMPVAELSRAHFPDLLRAALADHDIVPSRLVVEVSEEALDHAQAVLRSVREVGVGVLLDAFGTGDVSQTLLRLARVSALKIDSAYVDGRRSSITGAILGVGHTLGIPVMVDGVQTQEQRAVLVAAGCSHGQGPLFSEPLAAGQFIELLRRNGHPASGRSRFEATLPVLDPE
jgi:diguanylate cyclase (GGDEF)-like protein